MVAAARGQERGSVLCHGAAGGGTMAKGNKPQLTGVAPALLPGGAGAVAEVRF